MSIDKNRVNEIRSLTQFALEDEEFRQVTFGDDGDLRSQGVDRDNLSLWLSSGSIREKYAYSELLRQRINVTELITLVTDVHTTKQTPCHDVFVEYGELDVVDQVCLESGYVVTTDEAEPDPIYVRERVLKALSAVAQSRIE